jgi:hypothetical protein
MMKCPECKCQFREEEGKMEEEYEDEGESEMEGGEVSEEEMPVVKVKKVEVPSDKEDMIKKKLMELGKMLASIE